MATRTTYIKDASRKGNVDVIDGLDSTSGVSALSAYQGKVLNEKIEMCNSELESNTNLINEHIANHPSGGDGSINTSSILGSARNIEATSYNAKPIRPLISFTDDDGKVGAYTKLKPLIIEKNIPYNICIITNSVGTNGYMSWEQIKEMQNSLGCEILSHTATHGNIGTHLTNKSWIDELKNSKNALISNGLNVRGFAYPNGGFWGTQEGLVDGTSNGYWMTSLFYDYGIITDSKINTHPILNGNMGLSRCGIGSYVSAGLETLEGMKAKVDECVTNNGWLIFMTHVDDVAHTEEDTNNIKLLIDYIKSKNIDIVTLSEGFEVFGNIIETPNCKITKQGNATLDVSAEIPQANKSTHGIVKIGEGLSVADGIISVDGAIYYTKQYIDGYLDDFESRIVNLENNSGSGGGSSPTISAILPIKTTPNSSFDISYTAIDSDGILIHELSTDNGVTYNSFSPTDNGGNSFTYTTSIAGEGVYYCKLKITDSLGNSSVKSFTVTIEVNKIILTGEKFENGASKVSESIYTLNNLVGKYDVLTLFEPSLKVGGSYRLCFELLEREGTFTSPSFDVGTGWNVTQNNNIFKPLVSVTEINSITKIPFTVYAKSDSSTATNRLIYFQFVNTDFVGSIKFKVWVEE